jgi:hypothetical protein
VFINGNGEFPVAARREAIEPLGYETVLKRIEARRERRNKSLTGSRPRTGGLASRAYRVPTELFPNFYPAVISQES